GLHQLQPAFGLGQQFGLHAGRLGERFGLGAFGLGQQSRFNGRRLRQTCLFRDLGFGKTCLLGDFGFGKTDGFFLIGLPDAFQLQRRALGFGFRGARFGGAFGDDDRLLALGLGLFQNRRLVFGLVSFADFFLQAGLRLGARHFDR